MDLSIFRNFHLWYYSLFMYIPCTVIFRKLITNNNLTRVRKCLVLVYQSVLMVLWFALHVNFISLESQASLLLFYDDNSAPFPLSRRRPDCHYDSKLLTRHGVEILEDLVINLAEGITSMYLELISVDSNMSSEMSRLDLVLCSLSTRALQRLRNEVCCNQLPSLLLMKHSLCTYLH